MEKESQKVLPKKETVRIQLPPPPFAATALIIPAPFAIAGDSTSPHGISDRDALLMGYVRHYEEPLRREYGLNYIAFAYDPLASRNSYTILPIGVHESQEALQELIERRYLPAHPSAKIIVKTIDEVLYPEKFKERQL